jgi:hypothetical protein
VWGVRVEGVEIIKKRNYKKTCSQHFQTEMDFSKKENIITLHLPVKAKTKTC